jgi:iron complex transport system substrate-binding protein
MDASLVKGKTAADNFPLNSLRGVPIVAEVKPDYEKIQGIKPTLIVYDADLYNDSDIQRLKSTGAELYAIDAKTVEQFERQLYELANRLGSETTVSGYVDRIERERNSAQGDRPSTLPKVAVVLGAGSGSPYVAGTGSFVADIVKIAGGTPVGPSATKFATMSPEALVAASPDVLILATTKETAAKDVAALQADPRLKTIPAIRNRRITPIESDVVTRKGSRVDSLIRDIHRGLLLDTQTK